MSTISLDIRKTTIFNKNRDAKTRYVFNCGGSRSSKTFSINQVFFDIARLSREPIILSIVSETMPHLRKGAMRDFLLFMQSNGMYHENDHDKSNNIYRINRSIIEFFSVDAPGKVHGPERDYLFVNELQYISYDTFFHLVQRTRKQIFADWNPVSSFWVYENFIENPQYKEDVTVIHSTLFDNPFISEEIKKDILRRADRDPNYKRVYLEGLIGQIESLIYPNWSYGEFDETLPYGFGLDFGYFPDPDAMIKVAVDHRLKKIYARECFYLNSLSPTDLIMQISNHARSHELIIADNNDPRLRFEVSRKFNVKPTVKFDGSVAEGIRMVQDYDIVVCKESLNLMKEIRNYTWNDKKAGIPKDADDHLLSGLRYYVQAVTKKTESRQRWSG